MAGGSQPGKRLFQNMEDNMIANVGNIDRIIRIVAGALLIVWALTGGPVWAWIGLVPLLTGLIRYCPLLHILGMNTLGKKKEN